VLTTNSSKDLSDHFNYLGENEKVGYVFLSMEAPSKTTSITIPRRALVRVKKGDKRFLIPETNTTKKKDMIKYIKAQMPELEDIKFRKLDATSSVHFCEFEKKELVRRYKFGVLYPRQREILLTIIYT
jgi:hypothetical protein